MPETPQKPATPTTLAPPPATPPPPTQAPPPPPAALAPVETEVPVAAIVPDALNRAVAAEVARDGDEWQMFVASIRAWGIQDRLELAERDDGRHDLVDGERRWRAAQVVGLARVPAKVWPRGTRRADLIELGLVKNNHRRAHGALEIAQRLRELKNIHGETADELAQRTGFSLDHVKAYLGLYEAPDQLLTWFAAEQPPLRVAVELARFARRFGEIPTRRLLARLANEVPTVALVVAARRREEASRQGDRAAAATTDAPAPGRGGFAARLVKAFERDRARALAELESALLGLGLRVVAAREGK